MDRKGFAMLAVVLVVVAVLIIGGIWYYKLTNRASTDQSLGVVSQSNIVAAPSSSQAGGGIVSNQSTSTKTIGGAVSSTILNGRASTTVRIINVTPFPPTPFSAGDEIGVMISGASFSSLGLSPSGDKFGDGLWLSNGSDSADIIYDNSEAAYNAGVEISASIPLALCPGLEVGSCYADAFSSASLPLAISSGTYFLYIRGVSGTVVSNSFPIQIVPPSVSTSGWSTYTNPQYGFSFQYPPNWSFTNTSTANQVDFYLGDGNGFNISWQKKNESQSLLDYWRGQTSSVWVITSSTPMTINGYDALNVMESDLPGYQSEDGGWSDLLITKDNTLVLDFSYSPITTLIETGDPTLDAVLNSLSFQ